MYSCVYIYIFTFSCVHIYLFILTFIHGVTCCSKINLSSPVTKSGGGLNPLIGGSTWIDCFWLIQDGSTRCGFNKWNVGCSWGDGGNWQFTLFLKSYWGLRWNYINDIGPDWHRHRWKCVHDPQRDGTLQKIIIWPSLFVCFQVKSPCHSWNKSTFTQQAKQPLAKKSSFQMVHLGFLVKWKCLENILF